MAFSVGGFIQGLTTGARGIQEGIAERRKLEQQALRQALADRLLTAQIGNYESLAGERNRHSKGLAGTAQAYIQQYPELTAFAGDPEEVIARGRARDTEGLMRERPVADYPVVNERGEILLVPRSKQQTSLRPVQQQPTQQTPQQPGTSNQQPAQQAPRQPGGAKPTGIRRFQPGLITPSSAETDAANWAPGVTQGFIEYRNVLRRNPRAVAEAVPFLQALDITASIPGIGSALSGAARGAAQAGLSKEAQQVVQSFLRWTASRVFATGGKQLTQNEIRAAMGQYLPAVAEDPSVTEQRLTSMAQDAMNVLMATGRAYPKIKRNLIEAGAPDLGDFDPYTQTFTGQVTFQDLLGPVPAPAKRNRYGYTRPQ